MRDSGIAPSISLLSETNEINKRIIPITIPNNPKITQMEVPGFWKDNPSITPNLKGKPAIKGRPTREANAPQPISRCQGC